MQTRCESRLRRSCIQVHGRWITFRGQCRNLNYKLSLTTDFLLALRLGFACGCSGCSISRIRIGVRDHGVGSLSEGLTG
jgi:hypothetical protein